MGGGRDQPTWFPQARGPAREALGKVDPRCARPCGQSGVSPHQQDQAAASGDGRKGAGDLKPVRRAKGPVDQARPPGQNSGEGDRIWRPVWVGEHQEGRRQGLSPAPPPA